MLASHRAGRDSQAQPGPRDCRDFLDAFGSCGGAAGVSATDGCAGGEGESEGAWDREKVEGGAGGVDWVDGFSCCGRESAGGFSDWVMSCLDIEDAGRSVATSRHGLGKMLYYGGDLVLGWWL